MSANRPDAGCTSGHLACWRAFVSLERTHSASTRRAVRRLVSSWSRLSVSSWLMFNLRIGRVTPNEPGCCSIQHTLETRRRLRRIVSLGWTLRGVDPTIGAKSGREERCTRHGRVDAGKPARGDSVTLRDADDTEFGGCWRMVEKLALVDLPRRDSDKAPEYLHPNSLAELGTPKTGTAGSAKAEGAEGNERKAAKKR